MGSDEWNIEKNEGDRDANEFLELKWYTISRELISESFISI